MRKSTTLSELMVDSNEKAVTYTDKNIKLDQEKLCKNRRISLIFQRKVKEIYPEEIFPSPYDFIIT